MSWNIELTSQAEKDIRRLRGNARRALKAIAQLETDPLKGHALTGSLRGVRSLEFSMPGGEYRAAYIILDDTRICIIFIVGPHEGFYAKAERRAKALKRSDLI